MSEYNELDLIINNPMQSTILMLMKRMDELEAIIDELKEKVIESNETSFKNSLREKILLGLDASRNPEISVNSVKSLHDSTELAAKLLFNNFFLSRQNNI